MRHFRVSRGPVALMTALLMVQTACGQSEERTRPWASNVILPHCRPYCLTPSQQRPIVVVGVAVDIDIRGNMAATTLKLRLRNETARRQEAEILLPVPAGAVVRAFHYDGPQGKVQGQVVTKEEARAMYERLVAKMRDPALAEFAGNSLIRSSLFPVEPHAEVTLSVTYEHLLEVAGNRLDYVLPRTASLGYELPWDIQATIRSEHPIATVYCPTHKVYTHRVSERELSVKLEPQAQKMPGTFRLSTLVERGALSASFIAYPDAKVGGGYFLFLAAAPPRSEDQDRSVKREVTLVLDRSGSMRDEKIAQAKEAALQVLAGLQMGEAFNIVIYNDSVESFSPRPVIKNEESARAAKAFIEGVRAVGGTNLHGALQTALRQQPTPEMLPLVLFLTDGLPTAGETREIVIRDLVTKENPHRRRVFTFGVGYDVNTHLLEKLADDSKGQAIFVLPQEDVEVKVAQVFKSLAGPVLTDVTLRVLDREGQAALGRTRDILPARMPDLYAEDQLVLLGQYVGERPLTFEVAGQYYGKQRTFSYTFDPADANATQGFVARLWASRKIAELVDLVRTMGADPKTGGDDPRFREISDEIVRLSKEFGILTEYTAFLAREETKLADPQALRSQAREQLQFRAMGERSGIGSVNQSTNLVLQKRQATLNYDNAFYNEKMERVTTRSIQQVNDLAFYHRGGRWIDSRLADAEETLTPDKVLDFGSPEYFDLLARLSRAGRQGSLAFDTDVLLLVDGASVLVKRQPTP